MSLDKSSRIKIILVSLTIVVSVSSASILVKLTHSSPSVVSFWRLFISVLILSTWYFSRSRYYYKSFLSIDPRTYILMFVSGFFLALHFFTWIWSLRLVKVFIGTTIVDLYPLVATILAIIFLREYISMRILAGILLAILGVALIAFSSSSSENLILTPEVLMGSLVALVGAFAAGVYVVIGRYVRTRIPDLGLYVIPVYTSSTATLFILSLLEGRSILSISGDEVPWLILMAVGPMIGGHTLLNYILRFVKAAIASLLIILEPVGASIMAWIFLGEEIPLIGVLGMILAVAGVAIASTKQS